MVENSRILSKWTVAKELYWNIVFIHRNDQVNRIRLGRCGVERIGRSYGFYTRSVRPNTYSDTASYV